MITYERILSEIREARKFKLHILGCYVGEQEFDQLSNNNHLQLAGDFDDSHYVVQGVRIYKVYEENHYRMLAEDTGESK